MHIVIYKVSFTSNKNFFLTTSSTLQEIFDIIYILYAYSSLQSCKSKLHMHFKFNSSWSLLSNKALFLCATLCFKFFYMILCYVSC